MASGPLYDACAPRGCGASPTLTGACVPGASVPEERQGAILGIGGWETRPATAQELAEAAKACPFHEGFDINEEFAPEGADEMEPLSRRQVDEGLTQEELEDVEKALDIDESERFWAVEETVGPERL